MHSLQDAFRQLRRPSAQAIAIISIAAVTIGSSMAIFAMAKAVLFTDWMYRDPSRLAIVWHARANVPGYVGVSPGDVTVYQSTHLKTFASIAAVTTRGFNLGSAGAAARITCARMTAEMFPLLGVAPARGRWFSEENERSGTAVVVMSHALWSSRMGGDPGAIDREIVLDAVPRRVIGIMPDGFAFPPEGIQGLTSADCWVPASFTPVELATPAFNYILVGRIADGVSWTEASQDVHRVAKRIWSAYPAAVQSQIALTAHAVPLIDQATERSRTPVALLAGSVICLLLIGCANISNLLLTSFEARHHEIAVRASLGAARSGLVRQLLIESLLLVTAGGVLGTAVAAGLLRVIATAGTTLLPRLGEAGIDLTAVAVAVTCAAAAAVIGGVAPALAVVDRRLIQQGKSRGIVAALAGSRWRRGLIALEFALAVLVLVLAGVLARTVIGLNRVDAGFGPRDVVAFSIALPETKYRDADQVQRFRDALLSALEALPAVSNVAAGSALPIGEATPGVVVPAGSTAPADYRPARTTWVTPGYARTVGMSVRAGRFVEPADTAAGNVVVLNETLARTLWPSGDVIGRSLLRIGAAQPLTVVGVVADVRQSGPLGPAAPAIYLPLAGGMPPIRNLHVVLKGEAKAGQKSQAGLESQAGLKSRLYGAVASVDPDIPMFALRTGTELVDATIAVQRFSLVMVGILAAFSILLAFSGLFAVLSRAVQAARREFGIRQALGATRAGIVRFVLARSMRMAAVGIVIGMIVAVAATQWIGSLLFGVEPADPVVLTLVVTGVVIGAAVSVLIPALRAATADPAELLRRDHGL